MGLSSPSGWLPESPPPAKEAARESHYAVLGLRENASPKAVRRAYRKLKRTRTGKADEGRRRIEEAYEALADVHPAARASRCAAGADSVRVEREAREPAVGRRRQTLPYAALPPAAWLLVAFWPLLGSLRRRLGVRALPRGRGGPVLVGGAVPPPFSVPPSSSCSSHRS